MRGRRRGGQAPAGSSQRTDRLGHGFVRVPRAPSGQAGEGWATHSPTASWASTDGPGSFAPVQMIPAGVRTARRARTPRFGALPNGSAPACRRRPRSWHRCRKATRRPGDHAMRSRRPAWRIRHCSPGGLDRQTHLPVDVGVWVGAPPGARPRRWVSARPRLRPALGSPGPARGAPSARWIDTLVVGNGARYHQP